MRSSLSLSRRLARLTLKQAALGLILAAALGVSPRAAAQSQVTFSPGALIIPEQANFQTACGSISAYGLVWRILQSNQPGGYNELHPVTVYLTVNPNKGSPNRCVPSNLSTPPTPNTGWNDPKWNDGCDTSITSTTQQPVVPVDYTISWPASGIYPTAKVPMIDTTGTSLYADPTYASKNLTFASGFQTIQYLGGPFVIDAPDAQNVINFLKTSSDPNIQQFMQPCSCGGTVPLTWCHYVQMHQATTPFTAYIGNRMNQVPPKMALIDSGFGVASGILDVYLDNAGLLFSGAVGCPAGTFSGCGSPPGQIYDQFDGIGDLISTATDKYGLLNRADANGVPLYRVFWAPHWQASPSNTYSQYVPNGDGATTQTQNALNNIAHYADTKGVGLLAECASLDSYEGSWDYWSGNTDYNVVTSNARFQTTGGVSNNAVPYAWSGPNCTDPNYTNGSCFLFPNPADLFSQIGDFQFQDVGGHVHNYQPHTGSSYKPGVKHLAVSWNNYTAGAYPNGASADPSNDNWDFVTYNYKDNNTSKGTVVYLAGHLYAYNTTSGNRVVLNTLLNLGATPFLQERALSAPVAYPDPAGSGNNLIAQGTYTILTGVGSNPALSTFDPNQGPVWIYPYTRGDLRGHPLSGASALGNGQNKFNDGVLWDADSAMATLQSGLVSPAHYRNIFTYFGGQVVDNAYARNHTMQSGWVPEKFSYDAINNNWGPSPNTACVDVLSLGKTAQNSFGLTPGPDGVCDLQESLTYTPLCPNGAPNCLNPGNDYGGNEHAHNITVLMKDFIPVSQMIQEVRGFCFATGNLSNASNSTAIYEPTLSQCNCYINAGNSSTSVCDNMPHVGGVVRSTVAVVTPSPNISDAGGKVRPTVAYVGGWDGQLHAYYVGGGSGYTGPATAIHLPNPDATKPGCAGCKTPFVMNWSSLFQSGSLPAAGVELWSFIPPSQLPYLRSNAARVDSSPVVQDVFADFAGTGIREWHTVLVGATGGTNREIFALDITNPLKPALLWDIVGSFVQATGYPYWSPVPLTDATTTSVNAYNVNAVKWSEPTAWFSYPPSAPSTDPGRAVGGVYDFSDMGSVSGLSLGQLRLGLEPVYAVFAATNASGINGVSAGMEVFAIDAATGQRIWQWEEPYTQSWVDNGLPAVHALWGSNGSSVSRVYAGDLEGKLWELDANTGMNVNTVNGLPASAASCTTPGTTAPCKFPAFDTNPSHVQTSWQPITTNVAIAKMPSGATVTTGTALAPFQGATLLFLGTGGDDAVPFTIPGQLHVVVQDDAYRKPIQSTTGGTSTVNGTVWATQGQVVTSALTSGILQEPTGFPESFTGEHLFGSLLVAGQTLYFETAQSAVNDPLKQGTNGGGHTYSLDLGAAPVSGDTSALGSFNLANYGGVAVVHQVTGAASTDYVIGAQISSIAVKKISNGTTTGKSSPNPQLGLNSNGVLYQIKGLIQRFFR